MSAVGDRDSGREIGHGKIDPILLGITSGMRRGEVAGLR
jgi:hypothetical protein